MVDCVRPQGHFWVRLGQTGPKVMCVHCSAVGSGGTKPSKSRKSNWELDRDLLGEYAKKRGKDERR